MNKLTEQIKRNSLEYGSLPFWSWNDRLEEAELRRQIRNMHDMKINGFFMHARGGLETEYLSDEWYNCIKICIDEAKKLGMEAWAYDENGWPSGFAGGKLLEDPNNHSVYLIHELTDFFPENDDDIYALYALSGRTKPIKTGVPVSGAEKYLIIRYRTDSSYVDTMRADITEKFIAETHEQYKKRLGSDFGKAMPGFFTDEPQYYRWKTPYSAFMEKWFNEEYGYSVFDAIPALFCDFDGAESYRYDYHRMTHTKFMENFAKKIYDWASENNVRITGHGIEESSISGQMLCCGSVMPFYEYEHIPGIDYLGRGLQTPLSSKQLGSACEQLGKKKALSEMFACCGWDVTPSELKHIAELQYANGVNIMCQHLYPYSERGQRKRDYPAHYSDHNPWQMFLKDFDAYFNNLGYMLSLGNDDCRTLVIHPIHSAWLTYQRINGDKSVAELERNFRSLFTMLSEYQLSYHFGEEGMMSRHASVEGNTLRVGNCSYSVVILPALDTLDGTTADMLREFAAGGGKIYTYMHHLPKYRDGKPADSAEFDFLQNCEDLTDDGVFDSLCDAALFSLRNSDGKNIPQIASMVRETEYGKLIYLTNLSGSEFKNLSLKIKGINKLGRIDISSLELKPVRGRSSGNSCEILLDFDGSEAYILTDYDAPEFLEYRLSEKTETIRLGNNFTFDKLPENLLTLDRASVSYDGKSYTEERPIERIRDNLLYDRYKGELWLSYSFETAFIPETLSAVIEKPGVKAVYINGSELSIGDKWWFDRAFAEIDIAKYVNTGKNTLTLCIDYFQRDYVYQVLYGNVMESLRNSLVFDTEIEAVYIKGGFAAALDNSALSSEPNNAMRYPASKSFILVPQKNEIDVRDVVRDGYPFFGGKLEVKTVLNYRSGDPTLLKLDGRYCVCSVNVNGKHAGNLLFTKYLDLSSYLIEGTNTLTFTLYNSHRNFLGPHHCKTAEPLSVGPTTFSFEGQWKNDSCPGFEYGYSFVRFGIDTEN